MLPLATLAEIRTIVASAEDDPTDAMRNVLELLLPTLSPPLAALVYELVLKVNPEEIVDDFDYPLDARTK